MNYKKHLSISILTAALLSSTLLSVSEDSNITDDDYLLGFLPVSKDFVILHYIERLFFSFVGLASHFPKVQHYFDGSNDSTLIF